MSPTSMEDLFRRALEEPLGVFIEVTNASRFAINLHEARKALDKPEYFELMICETSQPDTIMIVKKSVELDSI